MLIDKAGESRKSAVTRAIARVAVLGLVAASAACSSAPPPAPPPSGPDPGVRPGDVVRLQVWREEDMAGDFVVDDRGIVTMPLIGDRSVAGMDPSALRSVLLDDYREYLKNPSIEVTVLRRVNIAGAVNEPGLYPVDATVSLVEALGLAGGVGPTGNAGDIRLVRDGQEIRRDLGMSTRVTDLDVRSGDRIVVGEKSWLARNPGALLGSLIAAAAVITATLIR